MTFGIELHNTLSKQAEAGDALSAIALALDSIAYQLKSLGNGDAATPMGGLEALGMVLKEGLEGVASSLSGIPDALENISLAVGDVAGNLEEHGK